MKKLFLYSTSFWIIVVFTSCEDFFETTLELDPPDYEKTLVLGAILNTELNTQRIMLTETVGLDEEVMSMPLSSTVTCSQEG